MFILGGVRELFREMSHSILLLFFLHTASSYTHWLRGGMELARVMLFFSLSVYGGYQGAAFPQDVRMTKNS